MDWNLVVSVGFTLGLLVIYIPQYYKMIKLKTSYGFHQLFMFLGHTAAFLSCLNSLIHYINNWWVCHGTRDCTETFLSFGLIIFQWLLFWIFYVLYLIYHPKEEWIMIPKIPVMNAKKVAIGFFVLSHLIMTAGLVGTLMLLKKANWHDRINDINLTIWSNILEVTILVMFLGHYIPQIYETIRLRRVGSLSLVTLGLMCPGTFGWTVYLALQKTNQETQSQKLEVWLPYLIVGLMQFMLLIIGIYYERKRKILKNIYASLNIDDEIDQDIDFFSNNNPTDIESLIQTDRSFRTDQNKSNRSTNKSNSQTNQPSSQEDDYEYERKAWLEPGEEDKLEIIIHNINNSIKAPIPRRVTPKLIIEQQDTIGLTPTSHKLTNQTSRNQTPTDQIPQNQTPSNQPPTNQTENV